MGVKRIKSATVKDTSYNLTKWSREADEIEGATVTDSNVVVIYGEDGIIRHAYNPMAWMELSIELEDDPDADTVKR